MTTVENVFQDIDDEEPITEEVYGDHEVQPNVNAYTNGGDDAKKERPPKRNEPRKSAAELLAGAYGLAGGGLVSTGISIPAGRVMQFQSAVAGRNLDLLFADSIIDRLLLQRLVKVSDAGADIGSIIALPVLVHAISKNQELGPTLLPILRALVRNSLLDMVPVLKKRAMEEEKAARALDELKQFDFGFEEGVDPVDAIIQSFFLPDPRMTNETAD